MIAHWEAVSARDEAPPGMLKGGEPGNSWSYNCRPIVEAGQALLVDDTFQLDDNFTLVPTPGHSPRHCCVVIRSQGQQAIVTGDLMHHALQCREPIGRPSSTPTPSKPRNRAGDLWGKSPTLPRWCCRSISRAQPSAGSRRRASASAIRSCGSVFLLPPGNGARSATDEGSLQHRSASGEPSPLPLSHRRGASQKYPTVDPRMITTASANRPPTIDTMTMSDSSRDGSSCRPQTASPPRRCAAGCPAFRRQSPPRDAKAQDRCPARARS